MKVTITRRRGRPGPFGETIEDPACPAWRHRHNRRGYREDGCRCPTTVAVYTEALAHYRSTKDAWPSRQPRLQAREQRAREQAAVEALPERERYREVDECPAERHRHPSAQWRAHSVYGCICPRTIKALERRREVQRESARRSRERRAEQLKQATHIAKFNLGRANRRDAEAIAQGYRTGKVDRHTVGMAVHLMLKSKPDLTTRQIVWRLDNAGQGPTSDRQVQRIIAALHIKRERKGLPPLDRAGLTVSK